MPVIRNVRFQQRRNTTEYWRTNPTFVPLDGEIIVYSDLQVIDENKYIPGVKIGDGRTAIVDLPFISSGDASGVLQDLNEHISNGSIHVSAADRASWDSKLNYRMEGETLIFTTG